jgi:hypothetical protein
MQGGETVRMPEDALDRARREVKNRRQERLTGVNRKTELWSPGGPLFPGNQHLVNCDGVKRQTLLRILEKDKEAKERDPSTKPGPLFEYSSLSYYIASERFKG